jgi:hypothetical protein
VPHPRGKLALAPPVAPTATLVGTLARFGSEMLGHLRLQELVQNGLEQSRHATVSLQEKRSWIFSSRVVISKVAIVSMSWLSLIGLNSNLTERGGFFYSAYASPRMRESVKHIGPHPPVNPDFSQDDLGAFECCWRGGSLPKTSNTRHRNRPDLL